MDLLVGHIRDMSHPVEGQRVVLAQGVEGDRPFDNLAQSAVEPPVALGREGGEQLRVALIASRGVEQRGKEPARRVAGAGSVQVEPERGEDLPDRALEAAPVLGRHLT